MIGAHRRPRSHVSPCWIDHGVEEKCSQLEYFSHISWCRCQRDGKEEEPGGCECSAPRTSMKKWGSIQRCPSHVSKMYDEQEVEQIDTESR